jgi:nucleoside-diphosphate-sugar epimerase
VNNIGTGVPNSLQDVVDALADAMGRPVEARWGEMAARPWDTSTWVADVSKANRLLGWRPRLDLSSGIGHCIEWFRDHVDLYADRARVRC